MKSKLLSVLIASLFAGAAYAADPMSRNPSSPGSSSTPGSSQGAPGNPSGTNPVISFEQLDKNSDGSLSRDEVKSSSAVSKSFGQLDADRDGKLSRTEYEAAGSSTSRVN